MSETKSAFPMTEVESSRIHSIGYDPESKDMHIRFRNKDGPGPLFRYPNFSADTFKEFADADSHGQFFNSRINIKDADGNPLFPFTRVEEKKDGE